MEKSGAPPDSWSPVLLLPIEFHGFTSKELSLFGSWSYLNFFTHGMGRFKLGRYMYINNKPSKCFGAVSHDKRIKVMNLLQAVR